jgi:hypothetical protein
MSDDAKPLPELTAHDCAALALLKHVGALVRTGEVYVVKVSAYDGDSEGVLEVRYRFPPLQVEVTPTPAVAPAPRVGECPECSGRLLEHSDGWSCSSCGHDVKREP